MQHTYLLRRTLAAGLRAARAVAPVCRGGATGCRALMGCAFFCLNLEISMNLMDPCVADNNGLSYKCAVMHSGLQRYTLHVLQHSRALRLPQSLTVQLL